MNQSVATTVVTNEEDRVDLIRQQIKFLLTIYPRVNRGFFHHTLLPIRMEEWDPVLTEMVKDGTILISSVTAETPKGRLKASEVIYLADQSSVKPIN